MSLTRNTLREKLGPGSTTEVDEAVVDALEGYIDASEQIKYRLPGKSGIVREENGQTDKTTASGDGTATAIITDRKLLFVVAAERSSRIAISYTEIKNVDAANGLFRSKLTVEVWGAGEYRFKIADSSELEAAVQYLQASSQCWDQVIATLDDVRDRTTEMGKQIAAGKLDAARTKRQAAMAKLDRAREYLDRFDIDPPAALRERIAEAERERSRTEVRTRISRAETLITEATHHTDSREYTQAYRKFWYSRDHLETARSITSNSDLSEPPEISTKLETIENRLSHLEVRPRALAQQACERARGTDKLTVELQAWEEAFEHYRDALTAGWGTELEFSGDVDQLRSRIEAVVETLIERYQDVATALEKEGDDHRHGHPETARDRYDEAIDQLEAALQLAREFRSGEPETIRKERDRLGTKRYNL